MHVDRSCEEQQRMIVRVLCILKRITESLQCQNYLTTDGQSWCQATTGDQDIFLLRLVAPRDVTSERTQQKTPFLAAATLRSHLAAGQRDSIENASSESSAVFV
jgi:hypothetical protein